MEKTTRENEKKRRSFIGKIGSRGENYGNFMVGLMKVIWLWWLEVKVVGFVLKEKRINCGKQRVVQLNVGNLHKNCRGKRENSKGKEYLDNLMYCLIGNG